MNTHNKEDEKKRRIIDLTTQNSYIQLQPIQLRIELNEMNVDSFFSLLSFVSTDIKNKVTTFLGGCIWHRI